MKDKCLKSLKGMISEEEYARLKDAADKGDDFQWNATMEDIHSTYEHRKYQETINANIRKTIIDYLNKRHKEGISFEDAFMDYIAGGYIHSDADIIPVERYVEGLREVYRARLYRLFEEYKPIRLGLKRGGNPEILRNIIKGVFKDSDAKLSKATQSIVDAIHQLTKELREDFNAAGGWIKHKEDFGLPITHYAPKLLKQGRDEWIKDVTRWFDIRIPADSKEIGTLDLLNKIYDNITSEQVIRGEQDLSLESLKDYKGKRALGNTHQKFRYLQPRNGDAWLQYMKKYGYEADPIDAIKSYIDHMSFNIGVMHKLGTNPWRTIDDVAKVIQLQTGNRRAAHFAVSAFDRMFPRNPAIPDKLSHVLRGIRAFETVTKLKLAGISTLTDPIYSAIRAQYRNLKPEKVFARYIKNIFTEKDFKTAAKLGLISEYADSKMHAAYRYAEIEGYGSLEKITDFAVRAYGINHLTNASKTALTLEFSSALADAARVPFEEVPKGLLNMLKQYNITPEEFKLFKKCITTIKGVDFLDSVHVNMPKELGAKISGMIREEVSLGVPEPGVRVRAYSTLGVPSNTLAHELAKMFSQFKTFGVSTYLSTKGMMLDKAVPVPTRMLYTTSLIASTSLMGFFVLQLKDIAKNRTPREFNKKNLLEGFLQGGAGGIPADFFMEDPRKYGGIPGKLVGPAIGDAQKVSTKLFTLGQSLAKGEKKKSKKKVATMMLDSLTTITPLSTAIGRVMLDQAYRMMDNDYYSRKNRLRQMLKKEGQDILWEGVPHGTP